MRNKTGVITGKFAPLHSGHVYAITQASTKCDHLYVILSHDQEWVDSLGADLSDKLSYKKKLLWLKTTFKDLSHITVIGLDETSIPPYPKGVEQWCTKVNKVFNSLGKSIDVWFSSEPEYDWWIKKYFNCEHEIIDAERSMFNISATKVRENPYMYWSMLPTIVRKEWLKKVVIIGTESSAKSTLTKYLAKRFNTSWVEEYGRTYCEDNMCGDESLLTFEDYGIIASERYHQEKEAESGANKLLICDTNAFVTQFYCNLYEGRDNPLVDAYIQQEKYDLVLHLSDEVKWVDDGLRINQDRGKTSKLFEEMLEKYKVRDSGDYHYITGDYNQRLEKAFAIVNNLFKEGK